MSQRIGIIGSGIVGQVLVNGFIKHGYEVMIGTNNPSKHAELKQKTGGKARIFNDLPRMYTSSRRSAVSAIP